MPHRLGTLAVATLAGSLVLHAQQKIYWADEVPAGLDETLRALTSAGKPAPYPIFKVRRVLR